MCWLVVAGLAKGDHADHDDFYQRVEREVQVGDLTRWRPTSDDIRLLKRETAARIRTEWEIDTQAAVLEALRHVDSGGAIRSTSPTPLPATGCWRR